MISRLQVFFLGILCVCQAALQCSLCDSTVKFNHILISSNEKQAHLSCAIFRLIGASSPEDFRTLQRELGENFIVESFSQLTDPELIDLTLNLLCFDDDLSLDKWLSRFDLSEEAKDEIILKYDFLVRQRLLASISTLTDQELKLKIVSLLPSSSLAFTKLDIHKKAYFQIEVASLLSQNMHVLTASQQQDLYTNYVLLSMKQGGVQKTLEFHTQAAKVFDFNLLSGLYILRQDSKIFIMLRSVEGPMVNFESFFTFIRCNAPDGFLKKVVKVLVRRASFLDQDILSLLLSTFELPQETKEFFQIYSLITSEWRKARVLARSDILKLSAFDFVCIMKDFKLEDSIAFIVLSLIKYFNLESNGKYFDLLLSSISDNVLRHLIVKKAMQENNLEAELFARDIFYPATKNCVKMDFPRLVLCLPPAFEQIPLISKFEQRHYARFLAMLLFTSGIAEETIELQEAFIRRYQDSLAQRPLIFHNMLVFYHQLCGKNSFLRIIRKIRSEINEN